MIVVSRCYVTWLPGKRNFTSGFLVFAVSPWQPNFTLVIVFSLESFSNHENVFCSKKRNA